MDTYTRNREDLSYTVQLTFLQFFITLILSAITFFIIDFQTLFFNLSSILIIALIYNGIMASFLAAFLETRYQKYTTPVKAALIFSLEPIIASVASVFVFKSIFSGKEILGAILMLSGIIFSEIAPIIFNKKNKFKNKAADEII
jgi:drug/metabolite transporter (DMT)-like permease